MSGISKGLVGFVALQHVLFLVMEMFLWQTPAVVERFGMTPEFAAQSATLAMNQGLYNGFLAAGLVWSLVAKERAASLARFFTGCVVVAGIFGGLTAKMSILFIQAVPGALALASTFLGGKKG